MQLSTEKYGTSEHIESDIGDGIWPGLNFFSKRETDKLQKIIQTQVDVQFSATSMGNGFVDRTDDILTNYDYFVYHTQPEIDNWADKMADTHKEILQKVVYGKSHEDRDLYALVIKDKQGRDNVPKVPLRVILTRVKT